MLLNNHIIEKFSEQEYEVTLNRNPVMERELKKLK